MNYLKFSVPRSDNKEKRGVKFGHSTRNASGGTIFSEFLNSEKIVERKTLNGILTLDSYVLSIYCAETEAKKNLISLICVYIYLLEPV